MRNVQRSAMMHEAEENARSIDGSYSVQSDRWAIQSPSLMPQTPAFQ
jgi:hypothetical protein